jgi:hypothetical protein
MGNAYAEAYGKGLALSKAKKLDIAENRLNERGSYRIVKGINNHLEELDMSGNKVGSESVVLLGKQIMTEQLELKVIKLEKAGLNDLTVITLVNNLL